MSLGNWSHWSSCIRREMEEDVEANKESESFEMEKKKLLLKLGPRLKVECLSN